jgi:beta-lactamase superfamily II metal-dependent hydrolase
MNNGKRYCSSRLLTLMVSLATGWALVGMAEPRSRAVGPGWFTLWQLPNQTHSQIMSYVLETPGRKLIVIDGGTEGDAAYLKGFLAAKGGAVEAWFVTHAHDDHFGALSRLLREADPPQIAAIYGSLPTLEWVKRYGAGAQDTEPYDQYQQALRKANRSVTDLTIGSGFSIAGVRFEVLGVHNPEITFNAINNSSLVLRVSDRRKSVLFLGDLGVEGGRKLLDSALARRLPSDYVQMAHHGQNGTDETFYRAVKPRFCLWPTPRWLWDNDSGQGRNSGPWKTLEVRGWMEKMSIKRHYLMAEGLAVIE